MSGIYIPGVTVPEDNTILLRIFPESDGIYYTEQLDIDEDILDKYFAIPVPEHGRLIDANVLTAHFEKIADIEWNKKAAPISWSYAFEDVIDDIANAPTIIPASGGNENE